jgi:hypothetical protein
MDIHSVLITAAEEVIHGVDEARKALGGKATVDYPTSIEVEFGITSAYEVANYDDVTIAKVKVRVPLFAGAATTSPASEALQAAEPDKSEKKSKGGKK